MGALVRRRVVHAVGAVRLEPDDVVACWGDDAVVIGAAGARRLLADPALAQVDVTVAAPGESVRVIDPLDVVEPRDGSVFPGWVTPLEAAPGTELHTAAGVAVLAAGRLPRNQQGLIELSGPGAQLTPFGSLHLVVVEFRRTPSASWEEVDAALRRGVLRLAQAIGRAVRAAPVEDVVELVAGDAPGLPHVGVITNLQTQGAFKDVFVYGQSFAAGLPTLIDPWELERGAVVSGQYGHPALRNPTYVHQHHPVVQQLQRCHGRDLAFAGVVLCPEPVAYDAKVNVSRHAAWMCRSLGWDGAVVTKEGGGNADNDLSLKLEALEDAGIRAVGLYAEMAGADGAGPPVVAAPRAGGMISLGNYDELIELPAVARVIGGSELQIVDAPAEGPITVPVATLLCALSPLGAGRLTCATEAG